MVFLPTDTRQTHYQHNGRQGITEYDQHGKGRVRHYWHPQAAAEAEAAISSCV